MHCATYQDTFHKLPDSRSERRLLRLVSHDRLFDRNLIDLGECKLNCSGRSASGSLRSAIRSIGANRVVRRNSFCDNARLAVIML